MSDITVFLTVFAGIVVGEFVAAGAEALFRKIKNGRKDESEEDGGKP